MAVLMAALSVAGCVALPPTSPEAYRFVEGARPGDGAHRKIASWQQRERAEGVALPFVAAPLDATLGADWTRFVSGERRAQAERVGEWIRAEARQRYVADAVLDLWPTSAEIFASDGDDCDGLELLALHALRALGFPQDALFRAVLERPSDGTQHMVTLWFETPEDPLVIDPTGFATGRMASLSELGDWFPRAIFTEQAEYHVEGPALAPTGAPE